MGLQRRVTLKRYWQLAIVTTVGICFLVVAGGVVRLTGSGLGCDDWPNCNDTRFIDVSSGHAAIEQVNRIFSGLIGIPTLALAAAGFLVRTGDGRRPSGLRWPAVGVLVTVLGNGVVGGIAVRGDLHPALVQSHFLLAMASIAFGLVAIDRADRVGTMNESIESSVDGASATPTVLADFGLVVRRLVAGLAIGTAVALVTGTVVTGTGPHAGEEDVRRFGFDISNVARIHSVSVLAAIAVALLLAWHLRVGHRATDLRVRLSTWLFVALLQGAIGYAQYFNGVPEVLVGTHLAGATLLWVLTLRIVLQAFPSTSRTAGAADAHMSEARVAVTGVSRV